MRRRHLDDTTFIVFPKRVILKRENSIMLVATKMPVMLRSFVMLTWMRDKR